MAINIQQPNYSGLVAIAGKSAPLNIAPTGALGLQALQQRQSNEAAIRSAALQKMQLQQQGQLGLLSNRTQNRAMDIQAAQAQNEMALKSRQLGMQGSQFQEELGFKRDQLSQQGDIAESEIDVRNRALAEKMAEAQMKELSNMKKEDLKERGAFASYGLLAMNGAKSPEEANQYRVEFLKEAGEKGFMTAEELKVASKLPLSQFQNALKYKIMQFGQVKEYKDMLAAQTPKEDKKSGINTITLPDGTQITTSTPTSKVTGDLQKDLVFAEDNLNQLKQVINSVPSNFFGASALKQDATTIREWAQGIPGVGSIVGPSEKDKGELEDFSKVQGKIKNLAMTTIKQLSGLSYTDKQLEFMNDIVPQVGRGAVESVFKGKSKNLLEFYEQVKKGRQELLKDGIDLNHPEYEEKMLAKMKGAASSASGEKEARRQHLRSFKNAQGGQKWSEEEINKELEKY